MELNVEKENIKETIFNHDEFIEYKHSVYKAIETWEEKNKPILYNLTDQSIPKEIIHSISEDILQTFKGVPLINEYDMYQYVMNYWYETMKDDIYMIIEDGWKANAALTPEDLFIERYFQAEQDEITQLEITIDQLEQEKEELLEEHAGEDSIFEEVKSDAGNITKDRKSVV